MQWKVGDIYRIVITGKWSRGYPVNHVAKDVKVIEVRRKWATVIYPCFNHWFATDIRFIELKRAAGGWIEVWGRDSKAPSWKRRHVWETACQKAEGKK